MNSNGVAGICSARTCHLRYGKIRARDGNRSRGGSLVIAFVSALVDGIQRIGLHYPAEISFGYVAGDIERRTARHGRSGGKICRDVHGRHELQSASGVEIDIIAPGCARGSGPCIARHVINGHGFARHGLRRPDDIRYLQIRQRRQSHVHERDASAHVVSRAAELRDQLACISLNEDVVVALQIARQRDLRTADIVFVRCEYPRVRDPSGEHYVATVYHGIGR